MTGSSFLCNSTILFHPSNFKAFSAETIISPVLGCSSFSNKTEILLPSLILSNKPIDFSWLISRIGSCFSPSELKYT
jgi:hypothetical protein